MSFEMGIMGMLREVEKSTSLGSDLQTQTCGVRKMKIANEAACVLIYHMPEPPVLTYIC